MTDPELIAMLNERAGWVSLLGRDHLLDVLREVRDTTARACAELCNNVHDANEILALFNLYRPPSTGGEGGENG